LRRNGRGQRALDLGALALDGELAAYAERNYLGSVSRPFPSWKRSMYRLRFPYVTPVRVKSLEAVHVSTAISLCRACACHEMLRAETAGQALLSPRRVGRSLRALGWAGGQQGQGHARQLLPPQMAAVVVALCSWSVETARELCARHR
jgi:hypothetical protein